MSGQVPLVRVSRDKTPTVLDSGAEDLCGQTWAGSLHDQQASLQWRPRAQLSPDTTRRHCGVPQVGLSPARLTPRPRQLQAPGCWPRLLTDSCESGSFFRAQLPWPSNSQNSEARCASSLSLIKAIRKEVDEEMPRVRREHVEPLVSRCATLRSLPAFGHPGALQIQSSQVHGGPFLRRDCCSCWPLEITSTFSATTATTLRLGLEPEVPTLSHGLVSLVTSPLSTHQHILKSHFGESRGLGSCAPRKPVKEQTSHDITPLHSVRFSRCGQAEVELPTCSAAHRRAGQCRQRSPELFASCRLVRGFAKPVCIDLLRTETILLHHLSRCSACPPKGLQSLYPVQTWDPQVTCGPLKTASASPSTKQRRRTNGQPTRSHHSRRGHTAQLSPPIITRVLNKCQPLGDSADGDGPGLWSRCGRPSSTLWEEFLGLPFFHGSFISGVDLRA